MDTSNTESETQEALLYLHLEKTKGTSNVNTIFSNATYEKRPWLNTGQHEVESKDLAT